MDDLTGLNWTSSASGENKQKPPPMSLGSYSFTLRPTPPLSGTSTPLTTQDNKPSANGILRSSASTPVNDSFANLISFNASNPNKNLSLQEKQKILQEERARQQQENGGAQFGRQDEEFWEKLGNGSSSPNPIGAPPRYTATEEYGGHKISKTINEPFARIDFNQRRPKVSSSNGNDLLADFDSLHGSPKNGVRILQLNGKTDGARQRQKQGTSSVSGGQGTTMADDDDPFGLGAMVPMPRLSALATSENSNSGDDVLGLLGRPVSDFAPPREPTPPPTDKVDVLSTCPADQALAELVDMGFAPEKSKQALESTESGTDVQAAVGWLLHQAHQESRSKSHGGESKSGRQEIRQGRRSPPRKQGSGTEDAQPAWMRNVVDSSAHQSRQSSRSPVNGEKDPSKIATELGNNLFKTANSLWKTGTKKLNKAVADLNSDSDSSHPKWMREPRADRDEAKRKTDSSHDSAVDGYVPSAGPQRPTARANIEVTDEARMLESAVARPPPRKPPRPKTGANPDTSRLQAASPSVQSYQEESPQPRFMQQPRAQKREDPKTRLNKQVVEEQTAEAYISPARRKKTTPKPPSSEPDLLFASSQPPSTTSIPSSAQKPPTQQQRPPRKQAPPRPTPTINQLRPQPPTRAIPPISPSALKISHASRRAGTAAFKLGNYAEATTQYTCGLSPIPSTHPLHIPLFTNRALSHIKTGDPKACIADTQAALDLIGPSRGVGETVDLGDEGSRDMHAYWGKAMTRQAEALEQLEKWREAGSVWKTCVEAGVGGATSILGRNRCEKAIQSSSQISTKPVPAKKAPPKPRPKPKVSALDDLTGTNIHKISADSEAVSRLRLANAALERLDDEKFALADTVSDRVSRWRSGKEKNLRALLASLDTVLWEGSGWKKVGMGELLLPGKVKLVYMRGIGRVHPDKVCWCRLHHGGRLYMLTRSAVTHHSDDRAEDDQRGGFRDAERGLGWFQKGEWAMSVRPHWP